TDLNIEANFNEQLFENTNLNNVEPNLNINFKRSSDLNNVETNLDNMDFEQSFNLNNVDDININTSNNENSLDIFNDSVTLSERQSPSVSNNQITIQVGQTFTDWNDVQQHINTYAINKGFATRLRRTERSMGFIIRADIVCRRAGTPIRWAKKEYCIRNVDLEHNHVLDSAAVMFDPGHRRLSHNENIHIQTLYDGGVPVPTIVNMLTEQYSRYIHINNGKLYCLFFATHSAISAFKHYPEITLMDSTYKTNRFGMPLLLISGVNAMGMTFLIASCLLANETVSNFCWTLSQLKQIAGDTIIHNMRTLVTDGDLALISAIRTELPYIKHQLCIWHIEQNIVKNLNNKLKDKFIAFSKDFKAVMTETSVEKFNIQWDCLLTEYTEASTYMKEQWEPLKSMWAYCYTNKYVNYGIRTTQRSEATNAHLKRLLNHMAPLPELINALEKLTHHQLQRYQYQQYRLRNSIRQQGPELLKDVSIVVSDFVYALLLEQYNMALTYDIKRQEANLLHVYYNENHKHTIYQTDNEYICSCNYNIQFALPCRHILAAYISDEKILNVDYIGIRWIIGFITTEKQNNITEPNNNSITDINDSFTTKKQNDITEANNNNIIDVNDSLDEFTNEPNHRIHDVSNNQYRNTSDLLKDIEAISNRVGHVEINNTLALFVEQLNSKYPLLQEDIGDPLIAKTKGRSKGTKRKKTGAEHATKKKYECSICSSTGHNARSCPDK
ncbi:11872_t:CDS:2, partial [Gigaspora margarita]